MRRRHSSDSSRGIIHRMLKLGTDEDVELLADRTIWGGIGGLITSMGLAQWSHLASLCAALFTCIFMCIRIIQIVRK